MEAANKFLIDKQLLDVESQLKELRQGHENFTPETLQRLQMQLITIISQDDFLKKTLPEPQVIPERKLNKQHLTILLNQIKASIKQDLN